MFINWKLGAATIFLAFVCGNAQVLYKENSPPILTLDRSWDLPVSEPIGSVVTRVKAFDQENDNLQFGLEMLDEGKKNPFVIDKDSGVVKLNESLKDRGGEKFLMYVTVNDGHLTMKTEVFVNIKNVVKGSPSKRPPRPPYSPPYLMPKPPLVHSEIIPPPKIVSIIEDLPKQKTEKNFTTELQGEKESVSPPSFDTKVKTAENSTTISSSEISYIIIPSALVCGILLAVMLLIFLFRRRLFKYRSKLQKDDLRKESRGGITLENSIAMHHWRGPRAYSNRYEGWDSERAPQPPAIQSDRNSVKAGDKWEFPRHHLKVFNILGEGCFGQVWRCEALNIDGKEKQEEKQDDGDIRKDGEDKDDKQKVQGTSENTPSQKKDKSSPPPKGKGTPPKGKTVQEASASKTSASPSAARGKSKPKPKPSQTPPRRPTEEMAMKLLPKTITEKLEEYYQKFVELRQQIRELQKEFCKLDRKRNRYKATDDELKQRQETKKQLKEKNKELRVIQFKIEKLKEAAEAKNMKPWEIPQEPPPEDEEDVCLLPYDRLPRVIICGTEKGGNMADMPKIVVCIEDSCKMPTEEEEEAEFEGTTVVAVKTLKENAGEKERKDLTQELEVMKTLKPHPNVVRLLGCCTDKDPLFVIMEFVALGKLQSYLRNSRAERFYGNMEGESNLTSKDLTKFAYQCGRGMEFLSSKGIIHRDLAARNILVSNDQVCKVADFGFARDIIGRNVYERKSEGRLPIRWMAPESLYDNIFSVKSDVWSFGVLVWEIVTLGSTPYPGLAAADVMRKIRDGYRLEKPDHCRRELYNIMYYCWDKDPKERPSFQELVTLLEQLLLSETDYIELDRFPDHSYYNMVSLSGEKL